MTMPAAAPESPTEATALPQAPEPVAPPQSAEPAAPREAHPGEQTTMSELEEIFRFGGHGTDTDPFAPPREEPVAPPPPPPVQPQPVPQAPAPAPAPPVAAAPKPQPPTPAAETDAQRVTRLEAELAAMRSILTAQPAPVPQQPPTQPQAPAEDPLPSYDFNVPAGLVDALADENPTRRAEALRALCTGVAESVHRQVRAEYRPWMQRQHQELQAAEERRQSVQRDFYGTYPQLDHPGLRGIVEWASGQAIAARRGNATWDTALRDDIARRAIAVIQGMPSAQPAVPQAPQPMFQTPAPSQAPAPSYIPPPGYQLVPIAAAAAPTPTPPILGPAARPGSAGNGSGRAVIDDVRDTLFGVDGF